MEYDNLSKEWNKRDNQIKDNQNREKLEAIQGQRKEQ
jgi:hypothetical protein